MNKMNCDCQQAKTLIALWAGHDLPISEEHNLRRHVAVCPDCKEYAREMKTCVKQLHDCSEPRIQPSDKCLWASLKKSLQAPEHPKHVRRFNGWTASLALAASFLAMFSIHQTINQNQPQHQLNTTEGHVYLGPHGRNTLQSEITHQLNPPEMQPDVDPKSDLQNLLNRGFKLPFEDEFPQFRKLELDQ